MTNYDQFMDEAGVRVTSNSSSQCSSYTTSPGPALESPPASYEEGWDDHEGPNWNDPLDAESVAEQAGLHRKDSHQARKRTPRRCSPSPGDKHDQRRNRHTISITVGDVAEVACPPDIEDIDVYMPSVEHKWFTMYNAPETIGKLNAMRAQEETEISDCPKGTSAAVRKAKGCGYSCKLHDIRRSGLVKAGDLGGSAVQVNRGAW
ncbi:hypothetical protein BDV97DRAFT_367865 [Delphinella strobiligena]|nr:hypothetical protein BDV97DRAFT_367865 [Delphinella strobiligena]